MPVKLTGPVFLFQVFGFHHHSFPNVSSDDEDVSQNLGSQKMVHVVDLCRSPQVLQSGASSGVVCMSGI